MDTETASLVSFIRKFSEGTPWEQPSRETEQEIDHVRLNEGFTDSFGEGLRAVYSVSRHVWHGI